MTDTKPKDKKIKFKRQNPNQLDMHCRKCGTPLDETDTQIDRIGAGYTELVTICPVCEETYYD